MSKSTTAAMIGSVSKVVHSSMRTAGFRRRGPHLIRQSEDVFHVIHFQASRWGSADKGRFTVNLDVNCEAVYEAWTGKPLSNPATASFPVHQRIGHLLPSSSDIWWSVDPNTSAPDVSNEVSAIIQDCAPPFFARFPSMNAFLSNLEKFGGLPGLADGQSALVHAFLLHRRGHRVAAQALVEKVWLAAAKLPFRHTIASFALRSGIEIPEDVQSVRK